jgi:hypothetical protein
MAGDDHSVRQQISGMLWNNAVFRTINEARRLAQDNGRQSAALNGTIAQFTDVKVPRITFIKICSDIGKHNFARLQGNVRKICRILKENGHPIDEGRGYLVLPEFYEWFHTHLFSYHASTIAEFATISDGESLAISCLNSPVPSNGSTQRLCIGSIHRPTALNPWQKKCIGTL